MHDGARHGRAMRNVARTAAAALAVALVGGAGTATAGQRAAASDAWSHVVVRGAAGQVASLERAVEAAGGRVSRQLPFIDGFAATVPAATVASLRDRAGVLAVTPDSAVTLASTSYSVSNAIGSSYPATARADGAWSQGDYGGSVGVAVIDTGVTPVTDLSGRVVAGPDFSGEHNSLADSFGHGTVMAGIIGGDGTASGGRYTGIAPAARIISVKVAGRSGATDVSTVLAAMQWVGTFAGQFGIRVVNLSWGTASQQPTAIDPLDYAVERLWRLGITVVVAAGNAGPGPSTITKPADDPAVITVGAFDDGGTADFDNDTVPSWTSRGPTADGVSKPDLLAPGRTLAATRAPGSVVEQNNPQALVGDSYILGSGTSQATAVTSGAAALLLAAHPSWQPDQVKYALEASARPLSDLAATTQGSGRIRIGRALVVDVSGAPQQPLLATGTGSLEQSRGGRHVQVVCPGSDQRTVVTGEMDARCQPFSADSWSADSWSADSWSADSWSADSWSADSWSADSWSADSWSADSWSADQWSTLSWDAWPPPYGAVLPTLGRRVVR